MQPFTFKIAPVKTFLLSPWVSPIKAGEYVTLTLCIFVYLSYYSSNSCVRIESEAWVFIVHRCVYSNDYTETRTNSMTFTT